MDAEVRARIQTITERVAPATEDRTVTFDDVEGISPLSLFVKAGVFDPSRGKSARKMAAAIIANPPRKGDRVLEIGCGSGVLSIIAFKQAKIELTAIDINPDAIACARKNFATHDIKAHLVRSDLFNAVRGRFDLIIFNAPTAHCSVKPGDKGETALWDTSLTLKQRFLDAAEHHLRFEEHARILMMYSKYRDFDSLPDLSKWNVTKLGVEADDLGESGALLLRQRPPSSPQPA